MAKPLLVFLLFLLLNVLVITNAKDACAYKKKLSIAAGDIASQNALVNCQNENKKSFKKDSNAIHVLKEIFNEIVKVDEEERKRSTEVVEKFVKIKVIEAMKDADNLFKLLFSKIYHTGSYYDRLPCGSKYDFDLNILLDVKEILKIFTFEDKQVDPGFIKIGLSTNSLEGVSTKPGWLKVWPEFISKLTETDKVNGKIYLMQEKVRRWFESILQNAGVAKLTSPNIQSVKLVKSGPAMTLKIMLKGRDNDIEVDLVPTFQFKCSSLKDYNTIYNVLSQNGWTGEDFFAIPKLSKKNAKNSQRYWRLDFHDIEKKIIAKQGFSKNIVRLLKVFRKSKTNEAMRNLSSYSLKTIVMLMIRDKTNLVWNEKNYPDLFLEALKFLKDRMDKGTIPYYFHHQCDVLWAMNDKQRKDMALFLEKTIKKLEGAKGTPDCRAVWRTYFGLI